MLDLEPIEVSVRHVLSKLKISCLPQTPASNYIVLILTNLLLSFIANIPDEKRTRLVPD
jgi:hypothetical protein